MRRVTVCAANIVAPVLTTPEVVVFFFTGMAGKAGLRGCLRRFILERNDFRRIAFCQMSLAGTMACFATGHFPFPTAYVCELGMRSMREGFELILVAILAGFTADVIPGAVHCWFGLPGLN